MEYKRIYPNEEGYLLLQLGSYGKDPRDNKWYLRTHYKGMSMGSLGNHDIVEHEDGTITVSPSILMQNGVVPDVHGYLEKGIWRDC